MFYFMKFVKQHNKEYFDYEEFHQKFLVFKSNLEYVDELDEFSPLKHKYRV